MEDRGKLKRLNDDLNELKRRLVKLKTEMEVIIKEIKVMEYDIKILDATEQWCSEHNVDQSIVFTHVYYAEDDDEDDDGYLTNTYEFTLSNDDLGKDHISVFISNGEYDETKVEVEWNGKIVGIDELPEKCQVAVNAIVEEPYFLL
jgi:hypothetical protein